MDQIVLLKKLGFTEYESRAYLSLAKLGSSSVREVVQDSRLPRNKAYEALQGLENKGRVVSIPLSPKKYKILDPEVFNEEVDQLKKGVIDLIKLIEQPKIEDYKEFFWVTKGRKAIHDKYALHNSEVNKELLICHKISKSYSKNLRVLRECVKRGVKVKILTPFDEKSSEAYKILNKNNIEIKFYDEKKEGQMLRVSVFDGKSASMQIGSPEILSHEDYIMLWTESKIFANMLRNYFYLIWNNASTTLNEINHNNTWIKTPDERELFVSDYTEHALLVLKKHKKVKKILDVACGNGLGVTLPLLRKGYDVHSFDQLDSALKSIKQNAQFESMKINIKKSSMYDDFPYKNGEFDSTFCFQALYHGRLEQIMSALTEIKRVTKKGGLVFFTILKHDDDLIYDESEKKYFFKAYPKNKTMVKIYLKQDKDQPHLHYYLSKDFKYMEPHYFFTEDELKKTFSKFFKDIKLKVVFRENDPTNKFWFVSARV